MAEPIIKVEGLSKRYRIGALQRPRTRAGEIGRMARAPFDWLARTLRPAGEEETLWALHDVSFDVARGEVVGIIGRNGAGKSTLLRILSRITDPTAGSAVIRGRIGSLLEVGTGFHPELTGRENIYLNGAILGMRRAEIARKFDEIVAFAEVEKFIDTPVKHYSSGMYVRLAFAVAAHLETEVLILDEVLAVGDAAFQKKCLNVMGRAKDTGRTVLFVSHNMAAVRAICNRCIWINDGVIHQEGAAQGVVDSYNNVRTAPEELEKPIAARTRLPGYGVKARIIGVELAAGDGSEVTVVNSQKSLRIRIIVDCYSEGVRLCPEISICDGETNLIFINSGVMKRMLFTLERGRHVFECEIPKLNLFAGEYSLDATLTLPGHEAVDRVVKALPIHVVECDPYGSGYNLKKEYGFGLFSVEHEWRKK